MMTLLQNISKSKIVVMGGVTLDVYFIGNVNRISPEALVPVLWVRKKTTSLGGSGNTFG